MKLMRLSIAIFIVMCVFIGVHGYLMNKMGTSLSEKNAQIKNFAIQNDWESARLLLEDVGQEWGKYRTWVSLTLSTKEVEELEISLQQAKTFAVLESKSDFFGEFIMFSMLLDHIPHREGFHMDEIL